MTAAPDAAKIEKVCFNADTPKVPTNMTEIGLSLLLIVIIAITWIVFSPLGIGA